jgi:hypothetical protein
VEDDALDKLFKRLASTHVSLLTLGSPLRQIYAQRFPDMYAWVVQPRGPGETGPDPASLGIDVWQNRWAAGDYIGRWLWHPYPRFSQDRCVGADAHTHYFDPDQCEVQYALNDLIAGQDPRAIRDADRPDDLHR